MTLRTENNIKTPDQQLEALLDKHGGAHTLVPVGVLSQIIALSVRKGIDNSTIGFKDVLIDGVEARNQLGKYNAQGAWKPMSASTFKVLVDRQQIIKRGAGKYSLNEVRAFALGIEFKELSVL